MDPDEWKNVGVSIIEAVKLLKQSQLDLVDKVSQIKDFMDAVVPKIRDNVAYYEVLNEKNQTDLSE